MNFAITEEQLAIQQLANSVFADFCSDERIKSLQDSGTTFDDVLWQKLAETGLLALNVSELWQGSGLGALEQSLVLEEQGRFLAQVPLWRHQIVLAAIGAFGSSELQSSVLKPLVSGEAVATLCTEANDGSDAHAEQCSGGWVLNGSADCVLVSGAAKYLLLPAQAGDTLRFFVVDLTSDRVATTEGFLTNHEPAANLQLTNVRVADAAALSNRMTAQWLEERIALCVSALQLGVTSEALRRAALYVNERQQFGRPIGSFQAVANRMADSYIELELLRSALWSLAWRLDNKRPALAAARVAKFQASQAGHVVGHTAQHYHGGLGQDLTYPIHRFYLWAKTLELTGGGSEAQLVRLSDDLVMQVGEE